MFTVNFKGMPNPKDKRLVKIEMILFRTGYNRTPKVLSITGLYKDWDQKTQSFKAKSSDSVSKNQELLDLKVKYLSVAESWEKEGKEWSPIQWSHCFESKKGPVTAENKSERIKILTISKCFDIIIEDMKNRKRFKNGKVISSISTARNYHYCRYTLRDFTKEVYNRSFSTYYFRDIDEQFLLDYVLYLQERGAKKGNKGGVNERVRQFYGVFYYSAKMGQPDIDTSIFLCVKQHYKRNRKTTPKTIPYSIIEQIEEMDKSSFSDLEQFHIDLFLFSFYTGGMANIDVCYLTWDSFQKEYISYERTKFPKRAKAPLSDHTKAIINKYKHKCYGDYVLPIFTHKHNTEEKQRGRIKRIWERVNKTLKKVAKELKLKEEFTWYAARGTYITRMLDEGFHPIAVAEFAGNSPATIYSSYWKQTNPEEVLKKVNQAFSRV